MERPGVFARGHPLPTARGGTHVGIHNEPAFVSFDLAAYKQRAERFPQDDLDFGRREKASCERRRAGFEDDPRQDNGRASTLLRAFGALAGW
jgi:hypothetical protein